MRKNMRQYLMILEGRSVTSATDEALPLLARYDGPIFRHLSKLLATGKYPLNLTVVVLSGRHGLLGPNEQLSGPEQPLSLARAEQLQECVVARLDELLGQHCYERVFVNVSRSAALALKGSVELAERGSNRRLSVCYSLSKPLRQAASWLAELAVSQFTGIQQEQTLQAVIEQTRQLKGVRVERCGTWLWVSGQSAFSYYQELKAVDFKLHPQKEMFYFRLERSEHGGNAIMEHIRKRYGSQLIRSS